MGFGTDFWWGTGLSANAAFGIAPSADLAPWVTTGRHRSEPEGNGFGIDFRDDLGLLAANGLRRLRLTLEWARIEPSPGRHDGAAIEHLRTVLEAARAAGVEVWACLHEDTLPGWFSVDERGYRDERSRRYFWARHAEAVGEFFGDLVHGWVPVFEPTRYAQRGWLDGTRPPGAREDAEGFAAILEGALLASVEAARILRQDGHPVATAHQLTPVFPARLEPDAPPTPEAEAMASVVDETLRRSWLRMFTEDTLVIPGRSPVQIEGMRELFDVVGFTYRHAVAVRGDGALLPYPQQLATGPSGQVPWAEGLGLVLHQLAEALPTRDLLIAGVGVLTAAEGQQDQFLRQATEIVEEAVDGGISLRGLWWDPTFDGPGAGGPVRGLFTHGRSLRPGGAHLARLALGS